MSNDNGPGSPTPNPAAQPAPGTDAQPAAYPPPQAPSAPPAYGATPPAYGATPPAYGANPPAYGAAPVYGAAPAYGAAPPYGGYGAQPKTNTLALVSLISAIVGILVVPFIGSVVAVVTGHMSLSQIKRTGEGGRGLGLTGTILGWVGIAFSVLGLIVLFSLLPIILQNIDTYR